MVLVSSCVNTSNNDPKEQKKSNDSRLISKGKYYLEDMRYKDAIEYFSNCIKQNQEKFKALNYRAVTYIRMGEFYSAENDLKEANKIDSMSAFLLTNFGRLYDAERMPEIGESYFKRAIARDPKYAEAYSYLGIHAFYKRNSDLAKAYFDKAIYIDQNDSWLYLNRGEMYAYMNKYVDALQDMDIAVRLANTRFRKAAAFYERGMILKDAKRNNDAIADFTSFIDLGLENYNSYYERGLLYCLMHEYKLALKDFYKAKELGKGDNIDKVIDECEYIIKN